MALPLDQNGYAVTALVTVGLQLSFFAIAYGCRFDLVTDLAGSSNFVLLAVLSLGLGPGGFDRARPLVLTALVCVARLELAGFLLYRVCRRKKDARFDEMRDRFFVFLVFWVLQMLWVWLVSLSVVFVNSVPASRQPALGAADVIGWALFLLGFLFQVLADAQKFAFRAKPENRGRFCDVGVWSISRHPNYFGEIAMWWGAWASAYPVVAEEATVAGWATLLSPLYTVVILLALSGLPFAEGQNLARYYENPAEGLRWEAYCRRTSPVLPLPPALYEALPVSVKRYLLCEFEFLKYKQTAIDVPASSALAIEQSGSSVVGVASVCSVVECDGQVTERQVGA